MRMRGIGWLSRASSMFAARGLSGRSCAQPLSRSKLTKGRNHAGQQMVRFGLAALVAVLGFASSCDWTTLVSPKTAGVIVGLIGVFKMLTNAIAPAPGKTAAATDGTIITHTAS
jgi:hypothetical protein